MRESTRLILNTGTTYLRMLVTVGIGAPREAAERLLAQWTVAGPGRDFARLEQLL